MTGGTGFVGSHTVAELVHAGHEVKLLARSRERVGPALKPHGISEIDMVEGDVTDPKAVERALDSVDAVVHAAAVFSLDPRQAAAIKATNVEGTRIVLGTAARLSLSPIVYVSSIYALIGERNATLNPASSPGKPKGVYWRSKADAELVAREYQDQGVPVVISYPGAVWGPDDPYWGESSLTARDILRGRGILWVSGTLMMSDVRDVALLHARLVAGGLAGNRYFGPTTTLSMSELFDILREGTGHRLPSLMLPAAMVEPLTRLADLLTRHLRLPRVTTGEGTWAVGLCHRADDSETRRDLGLAPRPVRETVWDTICWLATAGRITPKMAGRLSR